MHRILIGLGLALLLGACQKSAPPAQDARAASDEEPTGESAERPPRATVDLEGNDFAKMRFDFAATEGYNAYGLQLVEKVLIDEAMTAWQAGDAVTTTEKLQQVLEGNPVSIEAHRRLADMFEIMLQQFDEQGMGDEGRADGEPTGAEMRAALGQLERSHRRMADGLVKSITDSGDGKSPATAYVVISIPEEYMTMYYLKLKVKGQALIHEGDKSYDVLEVEDATGTVQRVYFDISKFAR